MDYQGIMEKENTTTRPRLLSRGADNQEVCTISIHVYADGTLAFSSRGDTRLAPQHLQQLARQINQLAA